jgi:hypothetical protein
MTGLEIANPSANSPAILGDPSLTIATSMPHWQAA